MTAPDHIPEGPWYLADDGRSFKDATGLYVNKTAEVRRFVLDAVNAQLRDGDRGCDHLDGPYRRLLSSLESVREWTRTTYQGVAAAQVQRLLGDWPDSEQDESDHSASDPKPVPDPEMRDLLAELQASVDRARGRSGGDHPDGAGT